MRSSAALSTDACCCVCCCRLQAFLVAIIYTAVGVLRLGWCAACLLTTRAVLPLPLPQLLPFPLIPLRVICFLSSRPS